MFFNSKEKAKIKRLERSLKEVQDLASRHMRNNYTMRLVYNICQDTFDDEDSFICNQ